MLPTDMLMRKEELQARLREAQENRRLAKFARSLAVGYLIFTLIASVVVVSGMW